MKQIPRIFYKATTQVWFYVLLPVFFLGFVLLYKPQSMVDFFDGGRGWLAFNVTMITCILLAVLAITRNLLFILRKPLRLNWLYYVFWCLMEVMAASAFMGLYMTLITRGMYAYFPATGYCLGYGLMVLCYPYVVLSFIMAVKDPDRVEDDVHLVRFQDNTGKLKCVIAAPTLLYIEADANNVHIRYVDGGLIKDYTLRNSMRGIEALVQKHGMVRCQRSYYINPLHVRVLRRDKEGVIAAELDVEGARTIPVSPKYYDALSKVL